jgi:hypothetical protein
MRRVRVEAHAPFEWSGGSAVGAMQRVLAVALSLSGVMFVSEGCKRPPAGVPDGAVPMAYGSTGGWAHCWLDEPHNVNRCRLYNSEGRRLYPPGHEHDDNDTYLRYEGSGPVAAKDLRIDRSMNTLHAVWLTNGQILIPMNDYPFQREGVARLVALRRRNRRG